MDRAEKKSDLPAQLWVEGILLDPAEGKLTRDRREGAAGAGEAAALAPDERISAVQKSLSDIPRLQQGKQQPKTVLTSMEQSTEGLHLVFYSDDLRLGNEVRVDRAGPDSIVVTVNGVRIAYKIPTGWLPVTK